MRKFLFSGLLSLIFYTASAQSWELGGTVGGSGYMGDLNPKDPQKYTNIAFGGLIKRNIDPYWSFKLTLLKGRIGAIDAESDNAQLRQRNLSFFSDITELSLQTEFNFFKYIPSISEKIYTPYIFTGISAVFFNPRTYLAGNEYELNLYRTEGQTEPYKTESLAIPYGVGVKYNFKGKWNLIGEIGYRTALTDYLDDVSGVYAPQSALINATSIALADRSGENTGVYTGVAGTQRGDFKKRDTYMFATVSLTYTFISPKCYKFR